MKKTVFVSLALFLTLMQGVFAALVVLDTNNSNWSNPAAWSGDILPGASDTAIIRNQDTVTINSDVDPVFNFYIGDTAVYQQTGTVNVVSGKLISLSGGTARSAVGRPVVGAVGLLNLSGGTLQMGAVPGGTNVLNIGVNPHASTNCTGIFTISGGTFDGRLLVGSAMTGDAGDKVRIVGSSAAIGTTSTLGNALEVRASGSLEFVFDAAGISTMNYGTSGNGGIATFAAGSSILVDGAAYTGGAKTFTLITAGTLGSANIPAVTLTNFPDGTTYSYNTGSDTLTVTVPAAAVSELSLPDIFAEQMVFQRELPVRIWGSAGSNRQVQVQLLLVDTNGNETVCASASATSGNNGAWELQLPAQSAAPSGSHHVLVVTSGTETVRLDPVYVGDVWICSGQSNMNFLMRPNHTYSPGVLNWEAEVAAAGDAYLNVFTVIPEADMKPLDEVHGTWRPDTPVFAEYFSAVPYLFGREIRRKAGVPVGIVVASLGATSIASWMTVDAQSDIPDAQSLIALHAGRQATYTNEIADYYTNIVPAYRTQSKINQLTPTYAAAYGEPTNYPTWQNQPGGLYNGMLAPLEKFPAKGVVWYQGESDSQKYIVYSAYLSRMIASWRELRGQPGLPFLIVQLPNYESPYANTWAGLREVQASAASISNVAVVVTADSGDSSLIHCPDKQTVAYRLGLAAMKTVYGQTNLVAFGPEFRSLQSAGSELKAEFYDESTGGLAFNLTRATGDGPDFEIAGADRIFYAAQSRIDGNAVYLSSTNVPVPVYAHYAYHNDPKLILYNTDGLPAAPFRASVLETLISLPVDQTNLTSVATNSVLTVSAVTAGPGLAAFGYDAAEGNPPPCISVPTTATPATEQAAVDNGCYLEVRVSARSGYSLIPGFIDFSFDIARSTGVTFSYAVRSSIDGFSADLCQADILTAAGTFATVQVPAPSGDPAQEAAFRIYFWDGSNDASRLFLVDTLTLSGKFLFTPEIKFSRSGGNYTLDWNSAPGRTHTLYKSDSLLKSRDQWEKISVPATAEGVNSYMLSNAWTAGFFYIE